MLLLLPRTEQTGEVTHASHLSKDSRCEDSHGFLHFVNANARILL
jgi:hypothetical protein